MKSSKQYRTAMLIWLAIAIMLMVLALLDPTMFIFAALAGFLAYSNRKRAKQRAAEEVAESEKIITPKGALRVRKGPTGLTRWK